MIKTNMFNLLYNEDIGKLILRLTVGFLILFHGIAKIRNEDMMNFIQTDLERINLPALLSHGVYLGEVIAPLLIILGIFTRLGGLLIVINMLFAISLRHLNEIFSLNEYGGIQLELQLLYLFCGLAIIFLGSGKYAFRIHGSSNARNHSTTSTRILP